MPDQAAPSPTDRSSRGAGALVLGAVAGLAAVGIRALMQREERRIQAAADQPIKANDIRLRIPRSGFGASWTAAEVAPQNAADATERSGGQIAERALRDLVERRR